MKNLRIADCCYKCKHMEKAEYPYEETIYYCNVEKTMPVQLVMFDKPLGEWRLKHNVECYDICDLFENKITNWN